MLPHCRPPCIPQYFPADTATATADATPITATTTATTATTTTTTTVHPLLKRAHNEARGCFLLCDENHTSLNSRPDALVPCLCSQTIEGRGTSGPP